VLGGRAVVFLLLAAPVPAQSLRVLSEFQRFDPFGEVLPVDRTPQPREIISPGIACNAFASFHIAVTIPPREPVFLFVGTNPPDVFQISLYEELNAKTSAGWIPDALQPSKMPAFGILPYLPLPIPQQNTLSYWMDVFVPYNAKAQRVRLEVLLKVGTGWAMYPMEIRVLPAVVPAIQNRHPALPPASARADAAVYGPFRQFICGTRETGSEEKLTVRRLIHRNALQDMALAHLLESKYPGDLRAELLKRGAIRDREAWCKSPTVAAEPDSEWYLHIRDFLYREASKYSPPDK
jgi:hypothetical protein